MGTGVEAVEEERLFRSKHKGRKKRKHKLKVVRKRAVEWSYRKHNITMVDNLEEYWFYIDDNYYDHSYDTIKEAMKEIDSWEDE